jgi:hypothetical protein
VDLRDGGKPMEMTMQKSNFSQEAIPPSALAVPDGFKQMPSAYDRMSQVQGRHFGAVTGK